MASDVEAIWSLGLGCGGNVWGEGHTDWRSGGINRVSSSVGGLCSVHTHVPCAFSRYWHHHHLRLVLHMVNLVLVTAGEKEGDAVNT